MFFKLQIWFYTKLAQWEYRKVDDEVCCCGSSNCNGDYSHSYVNAKNHAIYKWLIVKLDWVDD